MNYKSIICIVFLSHIIFFNKIFAQPPMVVYKDSYSFKLGESISPVLPTNTGGSIPTVEYGKTVTFAGSSAGFNDGASAVSKFSSPWGIAIDNQGNVFVADRYNNRIRKINVNGVVSTIAGSSTAGFVNGLGVAASFNQPTDVTVDLDGNLYVCDVYNHAIRKISINGTVGTLAGDGTLGYINAKGTAAKFNYPFGITIDKNKNIYVADRYNHRVRLISADSTVTTYAGSGYTTGINAQGELASFNNPVGISIDLDGIVYVGDYGNNLVRKIGTQKNVTTLAGCFCGGTDDENGIYAGFKNPFGISVSKNGDTFVADYNSNRIRRISPQGDVSTLAGSGEKGKADGVGNAATFNLPTDVVVDSYGNVYVADAGNSLIRKIVSTGYTITPKLPKGLLFNAATGQITGTPTEIVESAVYTVNAYNRDGSSKSVFTLTVTGLTSLDEISQADSKFSIYPNPVNGDKLFIAIHNSDENDVKVIIRDLQGRVIHEQLYPIKNKQIIVDFKYSQYDILLVEVEGLGTEKLVVSAGGF